MAGLYLYLDVHQNVHSRPVNETSSARFGKKRFPPEAGMKE